MAEDRAKRRLAAILAADVVGYGRLMGEDEAGTLAAIKNRRKSVLDPLVDRHLGRVFKTTGDGVLVEFPSAVEAVECAVGLQAAMAAANIGVADDRRLVLRIGVNLGDVMVDGADLYGDGVNFAARLEALAEPGGILVSAKVREEVGRKVDLHFDDQGEQSLKNIAAPVRAFAVRADVPESARPTAPPPLPAKPSIAVLPFTNMSGDPEQRYFSDGITEDIITELSRFHSLFVIARNSSFMYRDKSADAKDIGRALGVGYVVEGSVRKMGARLRITAQLIEAATGNHLWAERYDRDIADIFAVQDEVVQSIVAILPGRVEEAGARSARRKRPENLVAYDYLLRGIDLALGFDHAQTQTARDMFEKAIALDPTIAAAYLWLAMLRLRDWWTDRSRPALDEAFALARKAVATDPNDGESHGMLGMVCLERRQFDQARFHSERHFALNPNDPGALLFMGNLLAYLGRPEEAIAWIEKAFRLNPLAPHAFNSFYGMILFAARRYEESIAAFKRLLAQHDTRWEAVYLVAANAYIGRLEEARRWVGEFEKHTPGVSLISFAADEPFKDQADLDHLLNGLRKAGAG